MFTPKTIALGLAVLLLIITLPSPKIRAKMISKLMENESTIMHMGFTSLLISFIILNTVWRIETSWEGLIALIGWASLLKGIVYIWHPQAIKNFSKSSFGKGKIGITIWILNLLASIGIGYLGLYIL